MKKRSKFIQWVITSLIGVWGVVSFLLIACEENPSEPSSPTAFFIVKVFGIISLFLCILACRWLNKRGFIVETD